MESFGEKVKRLRLEKDLPLRTVAAHLDIDQAILSKMERGLRKANRNHVIKLAEFYNVLESDLLVSWLSDKLLYELGDEEVALKALEMAEEKVAYQSMPGSKKSSIISAIKSVLEEDGRVSAAYLYGSTARGEDKADSDVDIMVELNFDEKYSMFDLIEIAHLIEQKIHRRVDLVEKGYLQDFASKSAEEDLIKIYG